MSPLTLEAKLIIHVSIKQVASSLFTRKKKAVIPVEINARDLVKEIGCCAIKFSYRNLLKFSDYFYFPFFSENKNRRSKGTAIKSIC